MFMLWANKENTTQMPTACLMKLLTEIFNLG